MQARTLNKEGIKRKLDVFSVGISFTHSVPTIPATNQSNLMEAKLIILKLTKITERFENGINL